MKRAVLASWLLLQAATGFLSASSDELGPYPMRITMRHIEPNGVGYTQGYTTLEGFFAPGCLYRGGWLPYLDLRGHIFDNGHLAANAGLGLRYLGERRVWGVNAYYDYRNTHRLHCSQAAVGFEVLGEKWDVRLNGYLPVGKKVSRGFSPKFEHFSGHHLILSRKHEYALAGIDGEVGCHSKVRCLPVEVAAGPYYLQGNDQSAWGGKLRAALDFTQYFRLEGNVSYDHLFKWIGQGQASVIIPFSRRKRWTHRTAHEGPAEESPNCLCRTLIQRAYQRVNRSEIIPVDTRRKTQVAIDPATGSPLFFVFVDNLSGSDGTIEDPYATLAAAQANSSPRDIIYVFTGNGTATGMNSGIVLKDFQQLLGSSVTHAVSTAQGAITIPAFTLTLPVVGNTGGDVVRVANGNTISGLAINNLNGTGISQPNAAVTITNLTITNNTISSKASVTRAGIILNNVAGQLVIDNNEFGVEQSGGITLTNANINNAYYAITNNSIVPSSNSNSISLSYTNSSGITTQFSNNVIDSGLGSSVIVSASNSAAPAAEHTFILNSNKCIGENPLSFTSTNLAQMSITLDSNEILTRTSSAIQLSLSNNSSNTCLLQNNQISSGNGSAFTNLFSASIADDAFIDCTIKENDLKAIISTSAILINLSFTGRSSGRYSISDNRLANLLGDGIAITHSGTSHSTGSILGNRICSSAANGINVTISSSQLSTCNIENNLFLDSTAGVSITNTGHFNAGIFNNQFHQESTAGLSIALSAGGVSRIQANNNQFFGCGTEAVLATTTGANTSLCLQFNNNDASPTQYANGNNPFIFTNTAPALFQLETPALNNNEGYFTPTLITLVPPNTCE